MSSLTPAAAPNTKPNINMAEKSFQICVHDHRNGTGGKRVPSRESLERSKCFCYHFKPKQKHFHRVQSIFISVRVETSEKTVGISCGS
jgi:hypothetical protein